MQLSPRLRTRFLVVRHGQSDFNAQGRVQGCSDEPCLTEAGLRTADRVADYLQHAGITQVISSPLRRARDFAARICSGLNSGNARLAVEHDNRLREIELPLWEGLQVAAVQQNEPEFYRCWLENPQSFVMRSGFRPIPELYSRAASFWRDSSRFVGRTVLVVTHAGTARALAANALGIASNCFHSIQQSNGGLTILDSFGPARSELICLNATGHLGEGLPKLKDGRTGLRVLLVGNDAAAINAYREFWPRLKGIRIDRSVIDSRTDIRLASLLLEPVSEYAPEVSVGGAPEPVRIEAGFHTELWALSPSAVKGVLARALGENVPDWCFRKAPLGLTVLHFVSSRRPAVIQTIDVPDTERWPSGNEVEKCS